MSSENRSKHGEVNPERNGGARKKPYQKPSFRYEKVFETQALSCGKIAPTQPTCQFSNRSSS
jgi:hypothetical protein